MCCLLFFHLRKKKKYELNLILVLMLMRCGSMPKCYGRIEPMPYGMKLRVSNDFHSELSIDCNNDMDSEYGLRSLSASSVFNHSATQMDRP